MTFILVSILSLLVLTIILVIVFSEYIKDFNEYREYKDLDISLRVKIVDSKRDKFVEDFNESSYEYKIKHTKFITVLVKI